MTLYNGKEIVTTVLLNEKNKWSATVENLPTIIGGVEAKYHWKEQDVLGYRSSVEVKDDLTTFTNFYRKPRGGGGKPKTFIGEVIINHVGDCYD